MNHTTLELDVFLADKGCCATGLPSPDPSPDPDPFFPDLTNGSAD